MRLAALAPLLLATAAGAQVFKCIDGGHTVYSDAPCSAQATVLDQSMLRGNTVHRDPAPTLPANGAHAAPRRADAPAKNQSRVARAVSCPSDEDIRGLETKLSSIDFAQGRKRKEREFLERELRRARACRVEGGGYTADDWRRVKDAQDAQGNIRTEDRDAARREALDVHARKASEEEIHRMQADQDQDAARDAARRARAANAPRPLVNCDPAGCWDTSGTRYNGAGTTLFTSDGKTCTRTGTMLNCQ